MDTHGPEPTNALDNPRLRFFLEHRDQLAEWVSIADEVADAVAAVLRSVAPDVATRLESMGGAISSKLFGETRYGPVIHRVSWVAGDPPMPFVGVSLGWDGRRVDPVGGWPGTHLPYVGVNTAHSLDEGKRVDSVLRAMTNTNQEALKGYLRGSYWVVYRPLEGYTDWWRDVGRWRESVVAEVVGCWQTWEHVIAEAVDSARALDESQPTLESG